MKTVYLDGNTVREVIPAEALPVKDWYGTEFASHCIEVTDEVQPNWIRDSNGKFYPPSFSAGVSLSPIEKLQKENELLKSQVKAQSDRADFMEDCLAEMSAAVYKV